MFSNKIKIILIFLLFYQSPLLSKSNSFNDFNSNNISKYFSGIVAYENKDNFEALKFFKSSKFLIKQHNSYIKRSSLSFSYSFDIYVLAFIFDFYFNFYFFLAGNHTNI